MTSEPSPTRSWSSPSRDKQKETSPVRESHNSMSASRDKQKESLNHDSTDWTAKPDNQTNSSTHNWSTKSHNQRSVSPVHDSNSWPSSVQDTSTLVNTTAPKTNSKSWGEGCGSSGAVPTGWSGESSSGLSFLGSGYNKILGSSLSSTQRSLSSLAAPGGGGGGGGLYCSADTSNNGFETYRTSTRNAADGDINSVKKDSDSTDDPQLRVSSGSSSDSSLPPLSSPSSSASPAGTNKGGDAGSASSSMKMPRFCHECGHKYPVLLAKFCCHCGSRRASVEH